MAAASVIAKVHRDRLMIAAHAEHPGYAVGANKGYAIVRALRRDRPHRPEPAAPVALAPAPGLFAMGDDFRRRVRVRCDEDHESAAFEQSA